VGKGGVLKGNLEKVFFHKQTARRRGLDESAKRSGGKILKRVLFFEKTAEQDRIH